MLNKRQHFARFNRSYTELVSSLADITLPGISAHIEPRLQQVLTPFDAPALVVRVLVMSAYTPDFADQLAGRLVLPSLPDWTHIQQPMLATTEWHGMAVEIQLLTRLAAALTTSGQFSENMAVAAFGQEADATPDALEFAQLWADRNASVVVLHPQPNQLPPWPSTDRLLSVNFASYDPDEPMHWTNGKLFAEQIAVVQAYNALLTLDALADAIQYFLGRAERGVRVNKLLSQSGGSGSGGRLTLAENDPFSYVKMLVQQQFSQLEKTTLDQLDAYFLPVTGKYWSDVYPTIDTLTELETVEKAKTNLLRIPETGNRLFMKQVRKEIHWNLSRAIEATREMFRGMEQEIDTYCTGRNLPPLNLFMAPLTDTQLQQILQSAVRFERPYEANVARKGWYEYAMAVRRYQMFFFMMASTFGLSFIRRDPTIMIPASIALVSYGVYSIRQTVRQERAETNERELDKARDSLRDEAKRIGSEAQGRWRRHLTDYFKTQQAQLIRQIEEISVAWQQRRAQETDDEQRRLRRMMQGYEATERQISLLNQNQRTWQRTQQTVKTELRGLFAALR